ncbi:MAG: DNA repair protein RadC [Acetobacter sp.]|nr:DNA repair protein RadC [Acetobacter sp.]
MERDDEIKITPETPDYIGHRQRLKARFVTDGGRSMPDYELLELILMYALPRKDVKPLAKSLIRRYTNLASVLAAPVAELLNAPGVGSNTATLFALIHAAANKICWENLENRDGPILSSKNKIVEYCRTRIGYEGQEQVLVMYLDVHGCFIRDSVEHSGTIDSVLISPREIIAKMMMYNAKGVILIHNHPSGDTTPSKSDIQITKELIKALKTVDMFIDDHLIISTRGYYSFRERLSMLWKE